MGRDDLVRGRGGETVSLQGLTPGMASGPGAEKQEQRSVLLDSIRWDVARSSFLLNTAEGSGDLAGEQTLGL